MSSTAIKVENVNLFYKLVKSVSIRHTISNLKNVEETKIKHFQALKNISFRVDNGITLGIIGANGAGKTTLLKTIAGIFQPDSGEIDLFGHSASLLTLGAGFHLALDGIYNIYLNGTLLGFSRKEINERIQDIVEFADIGDFIYQPVKTYSSGMRSRLAFSIATIIKPEILLLDEVLGVGDEEFKEKSSRRMKEMIQSNSTVILVAHNMSTISEFCDQVLWLEKGEIMERGKTGDIIKDYMKFTKGRNKK